jgi:hypothetical protein
MVPLVLYSGGMDSTLMLYLNLMTQSVDTLYVYCNGPEGRVMKEMEAREKATAWFELPKNQEKLKGRVLRDHSVNLNETLVKVKKYRLIQPLAWLIAGLMAFDKDRHSEIQIGYIIGDTAPIKSQELKTFWKNAYALMHWCDPEDAPPVRFPLIEHEYSKDRVLDDLPLELADRVWVCEVPRLNENGTYRYCKRCASCLTQVSALDNYKRRHGWDYGAWVLHNRRQFVEEISLSEDTIFKKQENPKEKENESCDIAVGS